MLITTLLITLLLNGKTYGLEELKTVKGQKSNKINDNRFCEAINGKLNTYCASFKPTPGNFGIRCSNTMCKQSCCRHTISCSIHNNYPEKKFLDCVKKRVFIDFNDCCQSDFTIYEFNYLYAGIAIAILIAICGIFCALTMKEGARAKDVVVEKQPHLDVPYLIATDQDDIFWYF